MKAKIEDAFRAVDRLYIDSSPLIYFVESDAVFGPIATAVFRYVDAGAAIGVVGPVTMAECLVIPFRKKDHGLSIRFFRTITRARNFEYLSNSYDAVRAAMVRSKYNLALPDAFQVATALSTNCDAILTNDVDFKRVTEIPILVLSELEI